MAKNKSPKHLHQLVVAQSLTLISTSFGLVAALAWNEAIKEYVTVFIKPYFAQGSGVISLFIYALVVTAIAVIITIQTARLTENLGAKKD